MKCSFLEMLRIRLSIPHAWRRMLSINWSPPPNPALRSGIELTLSGEEKMDVLNVPSKAMYQALVLARNHASAAFLHWSDSQNQDFRVQSMEEWKEINRGIYRATRETKLKALQFRIMNRIVPCNEFLRCICIKDNDTCDQCGGVVTLAHLFFACPSVAAFRRAIFAWLDQGEDLHLENITAKQFLFGLPPFLPHASKIRLFHQGQPRAHPGSS